MKKKIIVSIIFFWFSIVFIFRIFDFIKFKIDRVLMNHSYTERIFGVTLHFLFAYIRNCSLSRETRNRISANSDAVILFVLILCENNLVWNWWTVLLFAQILTVHRRLFESVLREWVRACTFCIQKIRINIYRQSLCGFNWHILHLKFSRSFPIHDRKPLLLLLRFKRGAFHAPMSNEFQTFKTKQNKTNTSNISIFKFRFVLFRFQFSIRAPAYVCAW